MGGAPVAAERGGRPVPPAVPGWEDRLRPTDVIGAFFLAGCLMMLAGAVIAIGSSAGLWSPGRWLPLHLVFVGGVSQLVIGASQFFAGAFLATDPPSRALIRLQLLIWNAGTVALAAGVPAGADPVVVAATVLLLAGLGAYAAGLIEMRRRSLGAAPWASRWYLAAAAFFAPGIVAGAFLATGNYPSGGDLLAAHMALNLGGWFGAAIVGTLHTFFPSLTHSRLRYPRLQAPTFWSWVAGVAALAVGYGTGLEPLAAGGWVVLLIPAAMLSANLIGSLLGTERAVALPARIVAAAQIYLLAGLAVAAFEAVGSGPEAALAGSVRPAVGTMLLAGWIGMTVLGSLLHLLALLLRVRDLRKGMPQPRPLRDNLLVAWTVAAVGAVALSGLLGDGGADDIAKLALAAAYVVLGGKVALLAARVVREARPRV